MMLDFEKGEINVSKSCYCGKHGRVVDSAKTEHSKRVIPLCEPIIRILRKMKKESNSEYVISSNGKPVTTRSYQQSFENMQKKLHIPHRGFHALRPYIRNARVRVRNGHKTLSEIMGHKNSTVTLNRYAHSLTEHKKQ